MHMHLLRLNGRNNIMDCGVSKVGHGFGINGHLGTMEIIKTNIRKGGNWRVHSGEKVGESHDDRQISIDNGKEFMSFFYRTIRLKQESDDIFQINLVVL